ncbi:MAG TPA: hypothetical protein VN622_07760 [Clostridia bacterium]|nr:hypothetical protein [Clostridia bacterium]
MANRPSTARNAVSLNLAILVVLAMSLSAAAETYKVEVHKPVKMGVSRPLRDLQSVERVGQAHEHPVKPLPAGRSTGSITGAVQTNYGPLVATPLSGFEGVGLGNYSVNAAPPDTNGSVGDTQYIQWVNEAFAIFDKSTGAMVGSPKNGNTLWQNFGGGCQNNNDGDPIVLWDKQAHRWLMSQFSVSTTPYLQCIAVSQTADANGAWNLYAYSYGTDFNDYGKFGIWADGYYAAYNMFANGSTFKGSKICAFDRAAMLAGTAATSQCVQLSTSYGGLLPADIDGSTLPPVGTPEYFVNFGTNVLNVWKYKVDFANAANTTLTGPTAVAVSAFTRACSGGTCVPQPGTSVKLDSLADRLMYRLAYRNLGAAGERMVVNHSVSVGSGKQSYAGVRWYELSATGGNVSVRQQGTFAPDSNYRWMGSVAMDKQGNIMMGYSKSSSSVYPSLWYTARAAGDALGTMGTEAQMLAGGGSQGRYLGGSLTRWGDYSSISVDPTDDCTMFFTTEYLKSSGAFNWSTWVSKVKMPGCN